jgi:hypothetical protein
MNVWSVAADKEFWHRIAKAGLRVGLVPKILYLYTRNPESLSRHTRRSEQWQKEKSLLSEMNLEWPASLRWRIRWLRFGGRWLRRALPSHCRWALQLVRKMKLAFLLFDYFPFGGLQRDCLKTAQLCAARGHDVTIFTRTWQGERPANVRVELFGRSGFSNVGRNRAWLKQLATTLPQRALDGVIGFNKLPGLDVYFGSDPCYAAKVERLKPFWYRWLPRYRHFRTLEESVFGRGKRTEILVLTEMEIPRYQQFYQTERERFSCSSAGNRAAAIHKRTAPRRARAECAESCAANRVIVCYCWSVQVFA